MPDSPTRQKRDSGTGTPIEGRLREWLADEEAKGKEARACAATYHGHDVEAEIDLLRHANRHDALAKRIRKVLGE